MYVTSIPVSVPMLLKGQSSHKVVPLAEGERQSPSIHTEPTEILFFPFSGFFTPKAFFYIIIFGPSRRDGTITSCR